LLEVDFEMLATGTVAFSITVDTLQIITETIFSANHLTKSNYNQDTKQTLRQQLQKNTMKYRNKTKAQFTSAGQVMDWAYSPASEAMTDQSAAGGIHRHYRLREKQLRQGQHLQIWK